MAVFSVVAVLVVVLGGRKCDAILIAAANVIGLADRRTPAFIGRLRARAVVVRVLILILRRVAAIVLCLVGVRPIVVVRRVVRVVRIVIVLIMIVLVIGGRRRPREPFRRRAALFGRRTIARAHAVERIARRAAPFEVGERIALSDQARELGQRIVRRLTRRRRRIIAGIVRSLPCVFSHTHTATGPLCARPAKGTPVMRPIARLL